MKSSISTFILLLLAVPAAANLITADADGFSDGVDISAVVEGVTLSSVGGYAGLDGRVYACGDGLASTGTNVFANNLSFQRQWYADLTEGFALRADFNNPANFVSIDIIGDDSSDYGQLNAYDSSGTLLAFVLSPQLSTGQVFTAVIDRDWSFDIAYIIAGGAVLTEDTVHLDNLIANVIPEPATILLLTFGSAALLRRRSF